MFLAVEGSAVGLIAVADPIKALHAGGLGGAA
jgi:hypothetical protein